MDGADWHGTKGMWVNRMLDSHCDFKLWPHPWPWPWIFKLKYWKLLYLRNGRFDSLGMKGMWVAYDVECTMGLTLGHGAWQIDLPSNGSMWNSYSFQPVGQWMGYSFTDLGAEGCCRSLNALFQDDVKLWICVLFQWLECGKSATESSWLTDPGSHVVYHPSWNPVALQQLVMDQRPEFRSIHVHVIRTDDVQRDYFAISSAICDLKSSSQGCDLLHNAVLVQVRLRYWWVIARKT